MAGLHLPDGFQRKHDVTQLVGGELIEECEQPLPEGAKRLLSSVDDARMVPAAGPPVPCEREEVIPVVRDKDAAFADGKGQLILIGKTGAAKFVYVTNVEAVLAKEGRKGRVDVFVQQQASRQRRNGHPAAPISGG